MPSVITPSEVIGKSNHALISGRELNVDVGPSVSYASSKAAELSLLGEASFDGYVWAKTVQIENVIAQNGDVALKGATCDMGWVGLRLWGAEGCGLYASILAARQRLTISNVVGSFAIGELITQASSGAKGRYIRTAAGVAYLAHVSGTWDGTHSITGEQFTDITYGSQLLANPTFSGAVAGSPGTNPTSWLALQSTGDLGVSGSTLTFTVATTRRAIYQLISVTPGTYEFTVQSTINSGSLGHNNVQFIAAEPSGTTFAYYQDGVLGTGNSVLAGTQQLKIVATVINSGTMQCRIGAGIQSNATLSVSMTNPVVRTVSTPVALASADVSALTTDATCRFLVKSETGFDKFIPVIDYVNINIAPLFRNFIDCGEVTISGSPKRLLIWTVYAECPDCQIFYNFPDDDNVWTELLNVDFVGGVRPIRHWHGGTFISGLGPNDGTLVLFAGDTDLESSICVCDDVEDLLANPTTWKTRWGMDVAGQDRADYLDANPGYVWIHGSQSARTVELIVDPADTDTAYYLNDSSALNAFGGYQQLHKIDLTTGTVSVSDESTRFNGEGWYGCVSRGKVLISSLSSWPGGVQGPNSDTCAHLYVVERGRLQEIHKWDRSDANNPNGIGQLLSIVDHDGMIFTQGNLLVDATIPFWLEGTIEGRKNNNKIFNVREPIPYNYLPNSRWQSGSVSASSTYVATGEIDDTVFDSETGNTRSLKITPGATSGPSSIGYAVTAKALAALQGKWITASIRYLCPAAMAGTQLPYIGFAEMFSGGLTRYLPLTKSDEWQTIVMETFVPLNATNITLYLVPKLSGTGVEPVWFSDKCIAEGRGSELRNVNYITLWD